MIKPSLRFDVRARLPYDFFSALIDLEAPFLLSETLSCHWCSYYRFPYYQLSCNPFFYNPFVLLAIRALKTGGTPKAFDTNVSLSTLLFLIDVSFPTHFKRCNGVIFMVFLAYLSEF
ncbi:TPA: hypothetical protein RQK21_000450 [Vibrio vulnificus]|nr:hypothetical protein [Vibrio vulnificus]HDY7741466.1 hypothetical protein [Vibrio vulnificus]HDY7778232.1 hypothetical protein [Vibrio vulnificus]HDZ3714398.1 hypothetical protein [Vibrio vulnificus]